MPRDKSKEEMKQWAAALTHEQLVELATTLTEELVICGIVRFWGDCLSPYWEASGEPLVEGQKTHPDEDD